MLTKKFGFQYVYVLIMLSYTFLLFNFVPILDRHWVFIIFAFILAMVYSVSYITQKAFIAMLLYIIIVFINFVSGDLFFNSYEKVLNEFIQLFIPATMFYYLLKYKDYRLFRTIFFFFGVVLIYSTIISIIADMQFPGIMRLESSQAAIDNNAALLIPYFRIGLSDYALPHTTPVIAPGLVYCIRRESGWWKFFFGLVLVASVVLAYVSGSFTAFVMEVVVLIISFLISRRRGKRAKQSVVIIVLISLPFIFSAQLQYNALHSIKNIFNDESLTYSKLNDLEESVVSNEAIGSLEAREEKYESTFDIIINNLFIGTNTETIGGHSALPDRLALLGLAGFIPYLLFIYFQSKYTFFNIDKSNRVYYLIGFLAAMVMMSVKNMSCWSMWFMLLTVLPGLLLFMDRDIEYSN